MKKLLIALLAIGVIAGAAVLYLGANLDGIVEGLIEEHGSAATKTPVRVSGVSIEVMEATAGISRLSVGNPDGFDGNAIEMEAFSITLDAASLTSDVIVIKDILVDGARLNVIQNANGNNLQQLLRNLDSGGPAESPEDSGDAKKLVIERFVLSNASASLTAPDFDQDREVTLPTVTVRNVGRASNGAVGADVARQLLEPVFAEALESAAVQAIKDKADEALEDVKDSVLEGIFGTEEEPPR